MGLDAELEKIINKASKDGDPEKLNEFLQRNTQEGTSIKCSQRFLMKLDKLICRSLDQQECNTASLGLSILNKCGTYLNAGVGEGLSGLIAQGLIKKWFEKCKQLWIWGSHQWDENLFNLSEDFLEALIVVHEACEEGAWEITQSFLYPIGHLAADTRIYILIKKEFIRKFNILLDKMPVELKKERKLLRSQEASDITFKLAGQILDIGDYDLQTALMEALFRMAPSAQRKELVHHWFNMDHVASTFLKIHDSEFETDCRKFLNLVNGMQGDRRRVYSYPCLEVYLDKYELLMPADDKLEAFWIDFNLGSHCISFYFSLAEEEAQDSPWETLSINENNVQSYSVTEKGKRQVLQLELSQIQAVGTVEGSNLIIYFSSSLEILQATRSVYGHEKQKGFVGKKRTSVTKTTVKIIMEENSSQIVPESQISLGEGEKKSASVLLPNSSAPGKIETPAKMRLSESTIFISNNAVPAKRAKIRGQTCPELDASKSENTPVAGAVSRAQDEHWKLQSQEDNFVPDTQTNPRPSIRNKASVSEMLLTPAQKINCRQKPDDCSDLAEQQEYHPSSRRLSVPCTGPVSLKQSPTKLSKPKQKVINVRGKDPPPLETGSTLRPGKSQGRSHAESTLKEQQKNGLAKVGVPVETPSRTCTPEIGQQRIKQNNCIKVKGSKAIPGREERTKKLAAKMTKLIFRNPDTNSQLTLKSEKNSRHWIPPAVKRNIFNMSWQSNVRKLSRDVSRTENLTSSHNKDLSNTAKQRNDVFTFNIDPPMGTGGKDTTVTDKSAISSSSLHDCIIMKKGKPTAKAKRYVKRHLFSDTDTENVMTEASWLRESSQKPKPQIAKYSRQPSVHQKVVPAHTSRTSPLSSKLVKPNVRSNKNIPSPKTQTEQPKKPAHDRPQTRSRRLRRAAAATVKNYKEPESDDSQSEREAASAAKEYCEGQQRVSDIASSYCLEVRKRKKKVVQSKDPVQRHETNDQLNLKKPANLKTAENIFQENVGLKTNLPAQEQMSPLMDPSAAWKASSFLSPSFIERMRSNERSGPTLDLTSSPLLTLRGSPLPASPAPPCQDTPTVSNKVDLKRFSLSSPGQKKKYNTSMKLSVQPVHTCSSPISPGRIPGPSPPIGPSAAEISPIQQILFSASPSPLDHPLLTSTILEVDKPPIPPPSQSSFHQSTSQHDCYYGSSNFSPVSQVSLTKYFSKQSVFTKGVEDVSMVAMPSLSEKETAPVSDNDLMSSHVHFSGPTYEHPTFLSSVSPEDAKTKRNISAKHSPRIKRRKLFESFFEASATEERRIEMPSFSMVSSNQWEYARTDGDIDMDDDLVLPDIALNTSKMCQQFSSELQKKYQNRYKMVDSYKKESLKTVQQHVSSFSMQVTKDRTQRLKEVEKVFVAEIQKLEQCVGMLNTMEKKHRMFWKKQAMLFHSYGEENMKRNVTLKEAMLNTMCNIFGYEEDMFNSEMCKIRKDLKIVQDQLLREMQEGEIQSVKKGLKALFFPGDGRI